MSIFFSLLLLFFFFFSNFILASSSADSIFLNKCNETCGSLSIPLPFHLNSSCGLPIDLFHAPFHLSCINASTLLLPIGSLSLPVLRFFSKAIVVDLSDGYCHKYSDLSSFPIDPNSQFYGIAKENLLKLYGCEDSSICRCDCDGLEFKGCSKGEKNDSFSCCYSLSDGDTGEGGDGLSAFSSFAGCRGFSSWVVAPGSSSAERGLKLEWALPREATGALCAPNAGITNDSLVQGGARCSCGNGYIGDGFASGFGCKKCESLILGKRFH